MTEWLVDDGGNGSDPDKSTGSWATAFADLKTAMEDASTAAGDTYYTKSDTTKSFSLTTTITAKGTVASPDIVILCDASFNLEEATAWTLTTDTGNLDVTLNGAVICYGIWLRANDDLNTNQWSFVGGRVRCGTGSTPVLIINGAYNASTTLQLYRDVQIGWDAATSGRVLSIGDSAAPLFDNITLSNPSTFLCSTSTTRTCKSEWRNNDFSSVSTYLFNNSIGFRQKHLLARCKIASGVVAINGSVTDRDAWVKLHSCDNGDGYHYFEEHTYEGDVVEDTGVYLNATYDGTSGFSAKITPIAANVKTYTQPLTFAIPGGWKGDLSSSQIVTVELLVDSAVDTPAALNQHEFWINVTRPDGTDQALGVVQESRTEDIVTTPTAVTASTASWTGARTYTRKQKAQVTIPALAGVTDGLVTVEVCIAAESIDSGDLIYIDPDFDVSAV